MTTHLPQYREAESLDVQSPSVSVWLALLHTSAQLSRWKTSLDTHYWQEKKCIIILL